MSPFESLLCIFTFFYLIQSDDEFNPKEADYCGYDCKKGGVGKHIACICRYHGGDNREIMTDNMDLFRKVILYEHNKLRNYYACGYEKRSPYTAEASNMNLLNYDLELEYIAMCYLMYLYPNGDPSGKTTHDQCHNPVWRLPKGSKRQGAGQNIYWTGETFKDMESVKASANWWYDEVKYIRETTLDSYNSTPNEEGEKLGKEIGHFTATIWATLTHVGCSRLFFENGHADTDYHIVCNYKTPLEEKAHPNMKGKPVHLKGPKCSKCPPDRPCGQVADFPGLCGRLEHKPHPGPAPGPGPNPDPDATTLKDAANKKCVCFWLVVILVVISYTS